MLIRISILLLCTLLISVLGCSEIQENENSNEVNFEELIENDGVIYLDVVLENAKIQRKSVLLYFTGYNVSSCRKWEQEILNNAEVIRRCSSHFLFETVYVDDRRPLPIKEKTASCELMKKPLRTIGDANLCLQIDLCGLASQPYFLALNYKGETLGTGTYEDIQDKTDFLDFLKKIENSTNEKS